jgi:hypothetical protein
MLFSWFSRVSAPNRKRRSTKRGLRCGESKGVRTLALEPLESRTMLSVSVPGYSVPDYAFNLPKGSVIPHGQVGPLATAYTPTQIKDAYGFNLINNGTSADGTGTTIAIVDAYDDPTVAADLATFDTAFGVAAPPSLTVVSETGSTTTLPGVDPTGGWEIEESLDVQWAHAIAPKASILLVEANSNSNTDLYTAVNYARNYTGVDVVSMSWGLQGEFAGEKGYDSQYFTTPTGHIPETFVASTGDNGAPVSYPASSPNVLAVGGTNLILNGNNYVSETGWGDAFGSSGGGPSAYEPQPAYQAGVVPASMSTVGGKAYRTNPDVSYDADPATGFPVCDSNYNGAATPWFSSAIGGTSDAAPQWSALIAIADQGRVADGYKSLDGPSQTLPILYAASSSSFHDVTSGSSTGSPAYSAKAGYDLVTGRGTPIANDVVSELLDYHFTVSAPTTATAGKPFNITFTAVYPNGNLDTGYSGTVDLSSTDTNALAAVPATAQITNGVGSISVTLVTEGSQTITVTDPNNVFVPGTATLTVNPSTTIASIGYTQQPSTAAPGAAISPAVTVDLYDSYGNLETTDNTDKVSIALGANPAKGTLTGTSPVTVSGGVATFNNLAINKAGNGYTLVATLVGNGAVSPVTSIAFGIALTTTIDGFESGPIDLTNLVDLKLDSSKIPIGEDGLMKVAVNSTVMPTTLQYLPNSPSAFAGVLQSDLQSFSGGGETVVYNGRSGSIDDYTITFAGASMSTPITSFTEAAAITPTPIAPNVQFPATAFTATLTSTPYMLLPPNTSSFSVARAAVHDGVFGLLAAPGSDWLYRDDAAAQVSQGDTLSAWLEFAGGTMNNRAYLGFGANAWQTWDVQLNGAAGNLVVSVNGTALPAVAYNPSNPGAFATQLQAAMASYNSNAGLFGGGETVAYNGTLANGNNDYSINFAGNSFRTTVSTIAETASASAGYKGSFVAAVTNSLTYESLSLVAAPNTGQILLQTDLLTQTKSGGTGSANTYTYINTFTTIGAAAAITWQDNTWYQLEVNWSITGAITGDVLSSTGSLLQSVSASDATVLSSYPAGTAPVTSGGVAFRAVGNFDTYFDTLAVIHGVNSFSAAAVANTVAAVPAGSPSVTSNVGGLPAVVSSGASVVPLAAVASPPTSSLGSGVAVATAATPGSVSTGTNSPLSTQLVTTLVTLK